MDILGPAGLPAITSALLATAALPGTTSALNQHPGQAQRGQHPLPAHQPVTPTTPVWPTSGR